MSRNKSRRSFIKKSSLGLACSLIEPVYPFRSNNLEKETIGHGDFQFSLDKDWGVQNPNDYPVSHCHEMVLDSKNRIVLTTTHPRNNVLIYDRSGKIVDSWSVGYNGAHGLTINNEGGEDFLYITDPDSHKLCKTTLKGEIVLEINVPSEIKRPLNSSLQKLQFLQMEISMFVMAMGLIILYNMINSEIIFDILEVMATETNYLIAVMESL